MSFPPGQEGKLFWVGLEEGRPQMEEREEAGGDPFSEREACVCVREEVELCGLWKKGGGPLYYKKKKVRVCLAYFEFFARLISSLVWCVCFCAPPFFPTTAWNCRVAALLSIMRLLALRQVFLYVRRASGRRMSKGKPSRLCMDGQGRGYSIHPILPTQEIL